MDAGQRLLSKYQDLGIIKGNIFLLPHPIALKVIDECEKEGLIILGLDFWKETDQGLVEFNSADWQGINQGDSAVQATAKASRDLLASGLPDNTKFVSFVLQKYSR